MTTLDVVDARVEHAADVAALIRSSFAARPAVDPPPAALTEQADTVASAIAASGGLVALLDGVVVGALLLDDTRPGDLGLRRVSVDPARQGHGVASAMVGVAEEQAKTRGADGVWLWVREELPDTVQFWLRRGYLRSGTEGVHTVVRKTLPARLRVGSADETRIMAARLAPLLQAGDLIILRGELGAGKTTFTQGLGDALGVRGPVASPTFVLSRIHPSLVGGPDLVHVDAYRLNSAAEVDDLDLDATSDRSVTVVEWGTGLAEQLAESRLDISLTVPPDGSDFRDLTIEPHGTRWAGATLRSVVDKPLL